MYVYLYLSPKVRERINLAIGELGYNSNLVNLGCRIVGVINVPVNVTTVSERSEG